MNQLYYIELEGQQYGPYSLDQVKEFKLMPDTLVLMGGSEEWKPASQFTELEGFLSVQSSVNISPQQIPSSSDIFNTNFFYREEDQVYGPFSVYELGALDINENTLLGINNTSDWQSAGSVENLMNALQIMKELQEEEAEKLKNLLEEEARRNQEIQLNNDELKEVIEQQEKELLEKQQEIARLTSEPVKPEERPRIEDKADKEQYITAINNFRTILTTEENMRYTRVYPSLSVELLDKLEKFNTLQGKFIDLIEFLSNNSKTWLTSEEKDYQLKNEIISQVRNIAEHYYKVNLPLLTENYETASTESQIWKNIQAQKNNFPASTFLIAKTTIDFALFDELYPVTKLEYSTILDTKNILVYYDKVTRNECFDFINTVTGRLLLSSKPRKFNVSVIDTLEMEGISSSLKSLTKCVTIHSRDNEIRLCLEDKIRHVENIIKNVLLHPVNNIGEYNQNRENPEEYQFLIVKAFPVGWREDTLYQLKQIMKNGVRAGLHVILLVDKEELAGSEVAGRQMEAFGLRGMNESLLEFDFTTSQFPFSKTSQISKTTFENLNNEQLQTIIGHINDSLENKPTEVLPLINFLPPQSEWWTKKSARQIDIPFGLSENKELVNLSITQQSGENSALVIGVPGSGKSVFLHSIIVNSAVHYSPDELRLFLIDFSGVEFNTYALNKLPHASVIAPEAEREFGLSVLRELKEEGSRRMELCRNNNVSNIVELKEKNPDLKLPRLLVIIDEFQKLFENLNDQISREAELIINIIIKEFRKFGINLILATQKLADLNASLLPRDMIANRILFKCSPADVNLIGMTTVPQLGTGECIYNSELGVASDNRKTKSYFISGGETEDLLKSIAEFCKSQSYENHDPTVFRSDDLFLFKDSIKKFKVERQEFPDEVNVYFGSPLMISEQDAFAKFKKQSNDNILIIGGESEVAQKIAISIPWSIMAAHTDKSASFCMLNFMRPSDTMGNAPKQLLSSPAFDTVWPESSAEISQALTDIKTQIDNRMADENIEQKHVYLVIFALELGYMFKQGGKYGRESEDGIMLSYILNKGPLVGIFTILQVDNVSNLTQIGPCIPLFDHRIALQMGSGDSAKIMNGDDSASKLFVLNRPSSKNRGYYFDAKNNMKTKFRPYKIQC